MNTSTPNVSTAKLFDLFFESGLLQSGPRLSSDELNTTMSQMNRLRRSHDGLYIDAVHTNDVGDPIAHVSGMPIHGDNVWIMQQHCSVVPGHGVGIMLNLMHEILANDLIDYAIGFYDPKNKPARRIWDMVYDVVDNDALTTRHSYRLMPDYQLVPYQEHLPILFKEAFGSYDVALTKFFRLFARPTGGVLTGEGKLYDAVLIKKCAQSREIFKTIFK